MDLSDSLRQISAKIPKLMEHLGTEEATKNALVLPVINALGYNVFDPQEVVPEFTADVGTKKGEKVDYVIIHEGKPAVLVECKTAGSDLNLKHASQLFRYFAVTEARFAILTNGIEYKLYTDIERPNTMDEKPFFEFSMLSLDRRAIAEIEKFSKQGFDLENILSNASELKYKSQICGLLAQEMESPSEEIVKHFARAVYSGSITSSVKEQFTGLVRDAFSELIRERVNRRLQSALDSSQGPAPEGAEDANEKDAQEVPDDGIETTEEEIEAFQIVRAILSEHVEASRVVMRDTKSYCGVLLDDNNRKPLCRLRFNFATKYIGFFDAQKNEEKVPIEKPSDVFEHRSRLAETLLFYEPKDG